MVALSIGGADMANSLFPCTIFKPEDLVAVGHVHTDVCEARNIAHDSAEGEQVALTIMSFFQSGITDEGTLRLAMGLRRTAFAA
jgi:hypothetical protein